MAITITDNNAYISIALGNGDIRTFPKGATLVDLIDNKVIIKDISVQAGEPVTLDWSDIAGTPYANNSTLHAALQGYLDTGTGSIIDQASISGTVSKDNSTSTPLGGAATYTGTWEDISNYGSISIICTADQAGTLFADFSTDSTNVDRTIQLSDGTASFDIQPLIPVAQYFRVRLVNGATPHSPGKFRLQVIYSVNARIAQATSRLNQSLTDYGSVLNTRSVIANTGGTNVNVTDHRALQVTPPSEGKSAFGDALVSESSPAAEIIFHDFVNPNTVLSRANQSGTVSQANGMVSLSTGAASDSSAEIQSQNPVRYHPGQGVRARFTGLFTTGVANSTQLIGIGNSDNGLFFGYNGTSFGIMKRKGGTPEVRTLTVTTASTTDENITITLDGDANSSVAVTNTGNLTLTANEIAAADYSDTGRGWKATAVGDTVVFTSWNAGSKSGSYSLSGASTAVGTFAQTLAGASKTDTWTAQASWNGDDIFDGNGITGVTIDPTKGNVYQIVYQYLGFGAISFYIEDPDDGELHKVHTIEYANANTEPSLTDPSMPLYAIAENDSNTSDIVVKSASMSGFVDGKDGLIGARRGIKADITLGATADETPITTIRNLEIFQSSLNKGQIKILKAGGSVEHSKPVAIRFYKNATLTGASFSDLDTGVSIVSQDTTATAFTGGEFLFEIPLGKTGNDNLDFSNDKFALLINSGESITATIAPKSGNAAEATVSLYFVELF